MVISKNGKFAVMSFLSTSALRFQYFIFPTTLHPKYINGQPIPSQLCTLVYKLTQLLLHFWGLETKGEACSWLSAHHSSQNCFLVGEAMQTRFGGLGLNSESIHMEYRGHSTNGDKNCLSCSTSSQPEFSFPS